MESQKIGVYIDLSNINQSGGFAIRFDVLRSFVSRVKNSQLVRLNVYLAIDTDRAKTDLSYGKSTSDFHSLLRDLGYRVIEKKVKWYNSDSSDEKYSKSNADLEMAVDALLQSEKLSTVVLVTGDGDFLQVVKALQNKGCSVEVLGFKNVSTSLRKESDQFHSGYLIPNLLPTDSSEDIPWGEVGSRVRGVCFRYMSDKNYGFMRYLKRINQHLWLTDTRNPKSPYETLFFHESQLPCNPAALPSRDIIFEFTVTEEENGKSRATDIVQVFSY